jgi:hypothetical protein
MKPLISLWIVSVGLIFLSLCSHAESAQPIGFELYSWKAGGEWRYAVLEGTVPVHSSETIRSRKNSLKNLTYLKGRLAGLPSKEIIYWREDKSLGFNLPSKEIVQQIEEYAEGLQLDIVLPHKEELPGRPAERQLERLETR